MKISLPRARSIRTRMFLRTSAAMVLVIFCMVFFMRTQMISRLKTDQMELHRMETQNQLSKLDNYLMTLMVKTDMLFVNEDFTKLVAARPASAAESSKRLNDMRKLMDVAVFSLRYPEISIADYPGGQAYPHLYSINEQTFMDDEYIRRYSEIENEPFVQDLMTQRRMFSWNSGSAGYTGSYIAFNRRLLEYDHLTDVGVLQIRVPLSKVQQILSAAMPGSALAYYYLDMNGDVFCQGGIREPFSSLGELPEGACQVMDLPSQGGQCFVSCVRSSLNECSLILISSMEGIESSVDFVTPIFISGGIGTVALCTLLLFFLSGSLLKGLKQLTDKAGQAMTAVDGYEKLGTINDTSEIEALDAAYGKMVHTINSLHGEEAKYRDMINDVQIELLQEQFNPHLLYNTLSLIRHMSDENGQAQTSAVLDNLIAFYRRIFNRGQIVTRIRDEVRMIESYLNIIRDVYRMDLDVHIQVDEDVLDCCSVKLFLQPVVENAVMHGLREVGSGTLAITGRREDGRLLFVVEDDGLGIEPDKLAQIRVSIANSGAEGTENYGFVSTARRLRLFFGSDYSMTVDSAPGEGTRVEIRIPAYGEEQISAVLRNKLI